MHLQRRTTVKINKYTDTALNVFLCSTDSDTHELEHPIQLVSLLLVYSGTSKCCYSALQSLTGDSK